jgi:hypothetical protein
MSYLYSKLPETGVPHRIGTGGSRRSHFFTFSLELDKAVEEFAN